MSDANDTAEVRAKRLIQMLGRQAGYYRQVKELALRQKEVIAAKDAQALMEILSRKQEFISQVDAIGAEMSPLMEAWEFDREVVDETVRASAEAAVGEVRAILAEIVELENEIQGAFKGEKDKVGDKVVTLQKGKAMHKAYGGGKKPPPMARFKDKNI